MDLPSINDESFLEGRITKRKRSKMDDVFISEDFFDHSGLQPLQDELMKEKEKKLLLSSKFENVKKEYNSKVKEIEDMFDVRLRSLKEHVKMQANVIEKLKEGKNDDDLENQTLKNKVAQLSAQVVELEKREIERIENDQLRREKVTSLEEQIRDKEEEISAKVLTNNELLQNLKEEKLKMQQKLEKEEHNQNDLIRNWAAECQSLKDTISSLQTQIYNKEEELEGKQDEQVEKLNVQECKAIQQKLQKLVTALSEVVKKLAENLELQTSLMTKRNRELYELLSAKTDIEKSLKQKRNALHVAECEKSAQSAQIKELQDKITNFELVLQNDFKRSEQVRMLEERPQLSVAEKNFVVVYHQYQQLSVDHGALLLSRQKSETDNTAEETLQEKLEAEEKKSIELQQNVDLMKTEIEQLKDCLTSSKREILQLEVKLNTARSDKCSMTEYTKMKRELSDAKGKLSDVNIKCPELASQYRRSQDDLDKFKYAFQEQKKELKAMKNMFEGGKTKFFKQQGELKEARDKIADLTTQLAEGKEAKAALVNELNENQIEIKSLELLLEKTNLEMTNLNTRINQKDCLYTDLYNRYQVAKNKIRELQTAPEQIEELQANSSNSENESPKAEEAEEEKKIILFNNEMPEKCTVA